MSGECSDEIGGHQYSRGGKTPKPPIETHSGIVTPEGITHNSANVIGHL